MHSFLGLCQNGVHNMWLTMNNCTRLIPDEQLIIADADCRRHCLRRRRDAVENDYINIALSLAWINLSRSLNRILKFNKLIFQWIFDWITMTLMELQ